ncbi:ABC transporter permease [Solibacillus sp. FSL R5-0691]|uniref:ABC transporter permease n=1 Tax=Solibacillus sp. FSL R5-0691 TaxID=2921653 RepID=UPI0030CB63CE
MNMSMKRIQAIFVKDYKEFSRNYAVSSVVFMPMVLALFYGRIDTASMDMYFFPINMTFSMVTAYIQACLIAEEKERNTLRGLMMSPASTVDILLGKSLLVFLTTAVILAVSSYLVGYTPNDMITISIALMISAIFYLALGTICGLFTKSIMEASLAVLPVMVIFTFGPLAIHLVESNILVKVVEWLPSTQLLRIAELSQAGKGLSELIGAFSIITMWTVAAVITSIILFKKRTKDE